MLVIKNIESLKGTYVGHWKISGFERGKHSYYIKVIHNGSPYDEFTLIVDRRRTSNGDYRVWCHETTDEHYLPIECIKDRDTFIRFLIDELI